MTKSTCKQSHLRKDLSEPHGAWKTRHCCACGYVPTEGAP